MAKNGAGCSKDAGANDRADEEEEKVSKAKCADEFRHEHAGALRRAQTKGIITGDWKRSMGSWRKVERGRHETEEKDEKCKKRSPTAAKVERRRIVDGRNAKEAHAEEQGSPNVPALPETEEPERDENKGKKDGHVAVKWSAERTQNVAAVKLGNGQEIE